LNPPSDESFQEARASTAGSNRRVAPVNPFVEFEREEINQSIPARFEKQVRAHPDRIAVKSREHELTYADLNRSANRVAHAVLKQCGDSEAPVALLLDHGAPVLIGIMGALKAGKCYVPLDPWYPRDRLAYMVESSRAGLIITNNSNMDSAADLTQGKTRLLNLDALDGSPADMQNPALPLAPDTNAYILYTSGSTGQPKGSAQTHQNILHEIMNYTNAAHLCKEDRMLLISSCSFGDAVRTIYGALLNGAALYPLDIKKEGLADLADWIIENDVTVYRSVPTTFRHFASALTGREAFPSVRLIYFAGEPVYKRHVDLYVKHFPPTCIVMNGLGCCETLTYRWYLLDKETKIEGANVPVGYALQDKETLLLDDGRNPVPLGGIGEIAVRSHYLSPGYVHRHDLTAEKFIADPDGSDKRVYLTGDLGRMLPDGCIVHMGRKDFQVKIRGHRIESSEIEMALTNSRLVKDAIVIARENASGDQSLLAYVVPAEMPGPTVGELRRALEKTLPDYMIPAGFMLLEQFPLLPNGKVNRRALPEPDASRPALDSDFVAPRTPTEEVLASIWRTLLKTNRIGIHDLFLERGGDSLLAVRLFLEIEKRLGKRLPLATLANAATIAELAAVVEGAESREEWPTLVEIKADATGYPFFCVHTVSGDIVPYLPLAYHLEPAQGVYGLRAQGLDGKQEPLTRIEDMAALFLREVRKVQEHGPYLLGGQCFGGTVAFEMAQQLKAAGEDVALLALMDTPLPPYTAFQYFIRRVARSWRHGMADAERILDRPARIVGALARRSPLKWPAYISEKIKDIKQRKAAEAGAGSGDIRTSELKTGDTAQTRRARKRVDEANQQASQAYRPKPYDGRIALFLARKAREKKVPDLRTLWAGLASEGAEIFIVPGDHYNMLSEPHVGVLAEHVNKCIRRVAPAIKT